VDMYAPYEKAPVYGKRGQAKHGWQNWRLHDPAAGSGLDGAVDCAGDAAGRLVQAGAGIDNVLLAGYGAAAWNDEPLRMRAAADVGEQRLPAAADERSHLAVHREVAHGAGGIGARHVDGAAALDIENG